MLGSDEYIYSIGLTSADITVMIDGTVENSITKTITLENNGTTSKQYKIILGGFDEICGDVTVIIGEGTIIDTSGNESEEFTKSLGIIDFIKPVWEYYTSKIRKTYCNTSS